MRKEIETGEGQQAALRLIRVQKLRLLMAIGFCLRCGSIDGIQLCSKVL